MKNIKKYKNCNNKLSKLEYILIYVSYILSLVYCIYYLIIEYNSMDKNLSGWVIIAAPFFIVAVIGPIVFSYLLASKNLENKKKYRLIFEFILSIGSVILDYMFLGEIISPFIIIYGCLQIILCGVIINDLTEKNM